MLSGVGDEFVHDQPNRLNGCRRQKIGLAVDIYRQREGGAALRASRRMFGFSILYLFALFATLLIEAMVPVVGKMVG